MASDGKSGAAEMTVTSLLTCIQGLGGLFKFQESACWGLGKVSEQFPLSVEGLLHN